ncbi:MAG: substrate-binding domain-containing protein [Tepidisphaeraceae bacterium]
MPLPAFDGAIFAAMPEAIMRSALDHSRYKVVCSGGLKNLELPQVFLDDVAVGRRAAKHLIDLGLEHFAYFWAATYYVSQQRFEGFRSALVERGFACAICPIEPPTPEQRLAHAHCPGVIDWLRGLPKPVGILAFDDMWANDLAEACFDADILVPEQVSIVGVNNDDLVCETATPALSSVEVDYSRMGFAAAQILDRLMTGSDLREDERRVILPPLDVVQRQSSNMLAIKDQNLVQAVRFIREHACDPCSVEDVLREVPVGRRWLERQFMAQLSRTPHDEIARVRIEAGQRFLVRSDLTVYEVARRCGFSSDTSFSRFFEAQVGIAPAAFRRQHLFGKRLQHPPR